MEEINRELLYSAAEGDALAFSKFFELLRAKLYARALTILGHGPDAKDVVQDTYLRAVGKLSQLRDPEKLEAWLFSILRNECYLLKRSQSIDTSIRKSADFKMLQKSVSMQGIQKEFERIHNNKKVRQFISSLSVKLRSTVLLRYFSSFNSYQEISTILNVPIGTVRSRLSAARTKLRKMAKRTAPSAQIEQGKQQLFQEAWKDLYTGKRERFLKIFDDEIDIRFTSGRWHKGIKRWAKEWDIDLRTGVRFKPNLVVSAKDISIVEGPIINPPDKPQHCPPAGSFVFYHKGERVTQANVHYAER